VRKKFSIFLVMLAVSLVAASSASGQSTIVILNNDAAGVGFNDPTPVSPVGGNTGTTLGEQRLNAFQFAASIWGQTLNSGPTITIRASWEPLGCTATTATLGSAGTTSLRQNFPNAPFANTWFPAALANALAGNDSSVNPEIGARFNINIGTSGCLQNKSWYLGLDGQHGSNGIDLVTVLLHEFGHGLGFQTFTDPETGEFAGNTPGFPSVWDRFLRDNSTGKLWVDMTNAERVASAINSGNLVWAGLHVISNVPGALTAGADSSNRPLLYAPNPLEGGSSVSHFDKSAFPNLLMEPNINGDLEHSVVPPADLTYPLMQDIGWNPTAQPPPPPPANDNFTNAQTIVGCSGSVNGTNVSSTRESGEPDHASNGGTRSVWYQWQAPNTATVEITTAGTTFDTVLGVYTGNSVGSLLLIDQNDDAQAGTTTSKVSFFATAGTWYRIAVAGFNNSGSQGDFGNFTLNWNQNCSLLGSDQVEFRNWTKSGATSVYVKLTFADAGIRVSNWGTPVLAGNAWTVDAVVERFNSTPVPAITNTAQIYELGSIPAGNYTFAFRNSGTTVKTLNFTVSFQTPPANPIDDPHEFVRWQYKDFLRREPDGPGWDHWTAEITQCSDPTKRFPGETESACVSRKRANTSAAFFFSPEFLNTGYFVLRVYRGSLGRMPHFGGGNTAFDEFTRDAGTVSAGIVVNNQLAPGVINANKQQFVINFVNRAEFRAIYDGLSNTQYVDKLFQTTGVTPTAAERQALIDGLGSGSETRPSVLFKVVDGTQTVTDGALIFNTTYGKKFYDNLFNAAFVEMEYFGYLLRDPDDAGRAFWLNKLNTFGNWVDAQMVLAFITSPEYRSRFGAP